MGVKHVVSCANGTDALHLSMMVLGLKPGDDFFFLNDTATTKIYPLSLHDPLPISVLGDQAGYTPDECGDVTSRPAQPLRIRDRKSTRLNSSHLVISYAVFCLK